MNSNQLYHYKIPDLTFFLIILRHENLKNINTHLSPAYSAWL